MSSTYSRAMSAGTAAYAVFALLKPRHLGRALTPSPLEQPDYDVVARTYGARDLAISALAIAAPTTQARESAMFARIFLDLSDAATLTPRVRGKAAKAKVLGVTLIWATLNIAAVVADREE